jgi:hypothetical protein
LVAREVAEPDEVVVVFGGEVVPATAFSASPAQRLLTLQVEEELWSAAGRDGAADWVNYCAV